jgi:hypothetical protein
MPGAPSKPDFGLGGDFSQIADSTTVRDKLRLTQKQGLPPATRPSPEARRRCPGLVPRHVLLATGHWPLILWRYPALARVILP